MLVLGIQIVAVVSGALMVFLILLQEPKSGGLAMLGGTGLDRSMGVSNPLRKATVYFAIFFMGLSLALAIYGSAVRHTVTAGNSEDTPAPVNAPIALPPTNPAAAAELYVVKVTSHPADLTKLADAITLITNEKDMVKITEKLAGKVITIAPKEQAEAYQKQLEAAGATVVLERVTTVPPPPTGALVADPTYQVLLTSNGADLPALKKAISEITGEQDDKKLDTLIANKLILVEKLAKADEARAKLVKAGAAVDLVKIEPPAPAQVPAPAPVMPSPVPASGAAPATPPPAPAPTPAPVAPAPAPANP